MKMSDGAAHVIPVLPDLVVLFVLAAFVAIVSSRLRVPSIVGFLITGALAGPHGFALVKAQHEVELMAEIGVVLLLFCIGVELSISQLAKLKRLVVGGGALQVGVTLAVVSLFSSFFGATSAGAIVLGMLLALSSTAVVLKIFQERALLETERGKAVLGILIFQDIIIVPFMLVLPLLSGSMGHSSGEAFHIVDLIWYGVSSFGLLAVLIVGAYYLAPRFLYLVAKTRSQEVFLLSVVGLCFSVALVTQQAGLSLALGAFLAGLVISESEYSHQAFAHMLPFKDMFTSLFFLSVGMLFDISIVLEAPLLVLGVTVLVVIAKALIAAVALIALGLSFRVSMLSGFALAQVGEFSFVLAKVAKDGGLLDPFTYQAFLGYAVFTISLTPLVIDYSPKLTDWLLKFPIPNIVRKGWWGASATDAGKPSTLSDHVVIIGFGINGRNVARVAEEAHIPYIISELNVDTVRREQALGHHIYFGDASQQAVLEHLGVRSARVLVIAIADPTVSRRITRMARSMSATLHIIVRTRLVEEMQALLSDGANEVIPEEFETSIEIFSRVLSHYLVPKGEIESFIAKVRGDGYEMFRRYQGYGGSDMSMKRFLGGADITTLRVTQYSALAGCSLRQADLRGRYQANLLMIERKGERIVSPDPDLVFEVDDLLVLVGQHDAITKIGTEFCETRESEAQILKD